MTRNVRAASIAVFSIIAIVGGAGCHSPVGMAVQLVGKAVDSVETKQLGDELIGKPASAADSRLGEPMDVLSEVGGPRIWRVYSVPSDIAGNERYVVEVSGESVASVAKVKRDATGIDLARKMLLDQKLDGKTPVECEAALGMGRPLLTVRSRTAGTISQLYDARPLRGIGSPKYCRLQYDVGEHCIEVHMIDVGASSGGEPPT